MLKKIIPDNYQLPKGLVDLTRRPPIPCVYSFNAPFWPKFLINRFLTSVKNSHNVIFIF